MFHKMTLPTFVTLLGLLACSVIRTNEAIVPPPCPMENLMIDKSLFPEGWHQEGPPRQRSAPVRWGIEKLGVGFLTQENGVAGQVVHRGENFSHTEDGYFELVDSWFDSEEDATDWYIPPEFNYESAIANHDRFGCRTYKPSGVESCQLVGQYGVYLTRFHTFMSPIMTYDDLAHILQAIDDKMAQCLNE
jgi:hypothetical protein